MTPIWPERLLAVVKERDALKEQLHKAWALNAEHALSAAETRRDRDRARDLAVQLEQEVAETRGRLFALRRAIFPDLLSADEVIELIWDAEHLA